MYFAELMTLWKDIQTHPKVTLGFFEAGNMTAGGDPLCLPSADHDPEDPQCAKVHMTGTLRVLSNVSASPEAKKMMFWRHPMMASWPAEHVWLTVAFDIETIDVLDFYGGAAPVSPQDYYKATCH